MLLKVIIALAYLMVFSQPALAQDGLVITDAFEDAEVFPFQLLTDPTENLDFATLPQDGASWKAAANPSINLGYTRNSYWARFTVSQQALELKHLFFEVSYPLHDRLEIYIPDQAGAYKQTVVGDSFPFEERPIKSTRFLFELDLDAVSGKPIYVNFRSGSSMRIGMRLYSPARVLERNQLETAAFFLFYGTMSAMILYNLLLYISIRERTYIYYVFYILSHTLFQMSLNGHLLQFVLPDYPVLAAAMIPTLVGTTSIGVSLFTQAFLETRTFLPRCDLALRICFGLGFLLILMNTFLPYSVIIPFANLLPFYFSLVCFVSGFARLRQGYKPAGIYVAAFASFFSGAMLAAALTFGLVPSTMLTEYGAQIGSTIEVIMLSIALASKINTERKIRYEAQKNALELALEKEHSYEQISKLLYPHQLTMIQRGEPIERTMPTGIATACVLSFDVMNSSKVKNEGFSDMIEEFIADCRELMMRGYDGQKFMSNAYMIKEMGDGFLCSVGFPLKQVGHSKAECAVDLARQIIDRFSQLNEKLDAPTPIYCCIGVAMGQVRSYFSKSGSIKYDLWGSGIVLATRYESLRKEITQKLKLTPSNLLIIQEDVYHSLPSPMRKGFQVHSLQELGIQVRDHPDATTLVFMQIPMDASSMGLAS
jgi:class 3 adenylate cyclase